MIAYFMRRIVGGFAQLWVASFVIFYIVVGLPENLKAVPAIICIFPGPSPSSPEHMQFLEGEDYLNKPWPLNYFAWLFNPEEITTARHYDPQGNLVPPAPKGVEIYIGDLHIKGSGVLTGDLGTSMIIDQGTPVTDMFGPGVGEVFVYLLSLIAALMAITAAQRFGRPQLYRVSATPTASTLVDWWHLKATNPLDAAIINRQWGI